VIALDREIAAYYERGREEERLRTGAGLLEYRRTQNLLRRFLPVPPARVLDVGGGPGRYAAWLAHEGYEVTLIDPVPLHIEQARERASEHGFAALPGDARYLNFADESFDAVILLGPLYHLTERSERVAALREALRVVRPGGIVVAAAISRFASLFDGICLNLIADADFAAIVERDLTDGQHHAATDGRYFTTAFLHHPDELLAEARDAGLAGAELLAVEGPWRQLPDLDERQADPARWDALLRAVALIEREPTLLGASSHFVVVGRKAIASGRE
jgi:ubiquinone/menaquinone biosynthesis C-methylase UbiE